MSDVVSTSDQLTSIVKAHPVARFVPLVRGQVTEDRFAHIVRVTTLALAIAEANGLSESERNQVAVASMLHDAARDLTDGQLIRLAAPKLDIERNHPLALHGRAGSALAKAWGVTDQVVLSAIEGHVFGVQDTDLRGMALYVADVSEEGRGVNEQIRDLAMTDLKRAYRQAVETKVEYLRRTGKEIHPDTLATYKAMTADRSGGTAAQVSFAESSQNRFGGAA